MKKGVQSWGLTVFAGISSCHAGGTQWHLGCCILSTADATPVPVIVISSLIIRVIRSVTFTDYRESWRTGIAALGGNIVGIKILSERDGKRAKSEEKSCERSKGFHIAAGRVVLMFWFQRSSRQTIVIESILMDYSIRKGREEGEANG